MKFEVHKTQVRIDRTILANVIDEAKIDYDKVGHRDSSEGRSKFSIWNNISKFENRLFTGEEILEVVATADDEATQRVYYSPSVTSLSKPFRKCIVPLNPDNEFMFFDIKCAEFIMTAIFAGQNDVVKAYLEGRDPYDELKNCFPEGTPREHYKTTLIASLFGGTPYSTSLRLGISEGQADRLHTHAKKALTNIESHKDVIKFWAVKNKCYRYPVNLKKTEYKTMPYKLLKKTKYSPARVAFNENQALSVFTQSAFGYWMQELIYKVYHRKDGRPRSNMGTVLTVFDSMLIEINPKLRKEWEEFIVKSIAPFKADVSFGKTFYEAAYKE